MITMTLVNERETRGFFTKLPEKLRVAAKEIELDIAKDVQRGARFRTTKRFKKKTGRMWESIRVSKFGTHWGVKAGGWTAPYFIQQEYGAIITGWHFLKKPDWGKHGEGYSVKGGAIRIMGKFPFTDAIGSARARAGIIAERRLRKVGEVK